MNRFPIAAVVALSTVALLTATAFAQEAPPNEPAPAELSAESSAFDRDLALGLYVSHWHGGYESTGLGGRIRIESLFGAAVGLDLYTEVLDVDVPEGSRVDIPSGFNLFVPFSLAERFRLRALGGLCAMFSFAEGEGIRGGDADDVLFGYHVGAGAELALGESVSLFVDGTYQGYFGHDRDTDAWTGNLKSELSRSDFLQVSGGLQVHL